ncbi:MAG: diguanylate cyclase [Pseudomonadota bacterium]
MPFIKEENIGKISFITSVILVVFLTGIQGTVFLHEKYDTFQKNLDRVKNIYIDLQKERLKSEISIEIDRIQAQRINLTPDQEILLKQRIIRDLNFKTDDSEEKEYVFVYQLHDMNGGEKFATMLVNPNRPDLINTHISEDFKDAKGKMFRKQALKGIREKGEAFVTYWYKKPNAEGIHAKLSYFKYYPEWHWIIAKGLYLDDFDVKILQMQQELRLEIKKAIKFLAWFLFLTCGFFLILAFFFSRQIRLLFEGYKKIQKNHQDRLEHLNMVLEVQATTDTLTQIYNRAYFNTRMEQEMSRATRYENQLSLIMFDIDNFKQINDTFGHIAGDSVLKDICNLCMRNIRSSDILARWGGEEFVILLPESKKETAISLAEKLRLIFQDHSFSVPTQVTCSFGITDYITKESKDTFINRADDALYRSKETGKNKVTSA